MADDIFAALDKLDAAPKPKEEPKPAPKAEAPKKPAAVKPAHDPVAQRALALMDASDEWDVAGSAPPPASSPGYDPRDVYDASMRAFNEATRPAAAVGMDRVVQAGKAAGAGIAKAAHEESERWSEANARNLANLRDTARRASEMNRPVDVRSPMARVVPEVAIPTRTATPVVTPPSPGFNMTEEFEVGEPADPVAADRAYLISRGADPEMVARASAAAVTAKATKLRGQ